jgi:hypothetical protein
MDVRAASLAGYGKQLQEGALQVALLSPLRQKVEVCQLLQCKQFKDTRPSALLSLVAEAFAVAEVQKPPKINVRF